MSPEYIIVQAGGKGTRLQHLTRNKPKALTPIGNRPMLFHLFEKYPQKKYIIIGDYKCDVLQRYLKAFATVDYTVVNAHGAKGTCGGLRESLALIPAGSPFMLIWCDLVLPQEFVFPSKTANYVGISKDFPCRWSWKDGVFSEERSTEHGVAGLFLFTSTEELVGVSDEGEFVRWLSGQDIRFEELPLWRTKEYGVLAEYNQLESGRCRPFNRLIVEGDALIKEGIDEQGRALAKRERTWYGSVMDKGFDNIPHIYSLDPLKMERVNGKNVFEYSLSTHEKKTILSDLVKCLRGIQALGEIPADPQSYYDNYIDKTFKRLDQVWDLIPLARDKQITVNGKRCRNVLHYRDELQALVAKFEPATFRFIHGDCTFSNIMLRGGKTPVIIDPRGYFGRTELYGDPAYDWAKLYYSIVGNYDQFNLKRFSLTIGETDVELSIESNHWEDMEQEFFRLLEGEVCPEQIKVFHAIIWLSLTTYAWEDYDSICGAFYNGLRYLEEVLP